MKSTLPNCYSYLAKSLTAANVSTIKTVSRPMVGAHVLPLGFVYPGSARYTTSRDQKRR
jgi:hypothetical protein